MFLKITLLRRSQVQKKLLKIFNFLCALAVVVNTLDQSCSFISENNENENNANEDSTKAKKSNGNAYLNARLLNECKNNERMSEWKPRFILYIF